MKLTKVTLVDHLNGGLDVCQLELDGGKDSAYIIYEYNNMLQYLDGEVVATFRNDMYKGQVHKFINTIARVGVIETLSREDSFKLCIDKVDNHSNIAFKDLREGETVKQAIVYVIDVEFDSNARAAWCNLTVQDKERRIATLRIFNPSTNSDALKNRYVSCDIRKNKYGLSTESVMTVDATFTHSPEVTVAIKFVEQAFADDREMLSVLSDSNFIQFAKHHVSEEPGYVLVRLAMELDLCNETANLTNDVNIDVVRKALLMSKFYVLNTTSVLARDLITYTIVSRYKYVGYKDVLVLLFSEDKSMAKERRLFNSISSMADALVRIKKGVD